MKTVAREDDDRLQVREVQNRPPDFAELYDQNFDRIYAFLVRRVRSQDQAQDLTAEVAPGSESPLSPFAG